VGLYDVPQRIGRHASNHHLKPIFLHQNMRLLHLLSGRKGHRTRSLRFHYRASSNLAGVYPRRIPGPTQHQRSSGTHYRTDAVLSSRGRLAVRQTLMGPIISTRIQTIVNFIDPDEQQPEPALRHPQLLINRHQKPLRDPQPRGAIPPVRCSPLRNEYEKMQNSKNAERMAQLR
jgi:hypothetical protein